MNIHSNQPVLTAGTALNEAKAAVILIHGRGANAQSILTLSNHFRQDGIAYLAPDAAGGQWYPQRFLVPQEDNEPYLSSAKAKIASVFDMVKEAGIQPEKTVFLGFSQGACLATEFTARNAQRYGGIVGLSGGLIGTDEEITGYTGSLDGTPVFLGCSDVDFHIPKERVQLSADVMNELGADVTMKLYANMDHTVNMDEIEHVRAILARVLAE